jgi:glycosyltransferase involved in cell wall biosynthesis
LALANNRAATLYALLSSFRPGRKPPLLFFDCLWYLPKTRFARAINRLKFQLISRSVRKFLVWSSHEVRDYASVFGLSEELFLYVPHHHTLEGYEYEVTRGDYVFSGGDGNRDYPTLIEAVRGLDVKVKIATRREDWHGGVTAPPNVEASPTSSDDFRRWMAGSRVVVVAMQKKGLLHIGGEQTYLNAMAMGKPVIVTDEVGAADYIQHGRNGLLVPSGDVSALRAAIRSILNDPAFEVELASNARKSYEEFSTHLCMERILALAAEVAEAGKK